MSRFRKRGTTALVAVTALAALVAASQAAPRTQLVSRTSAGVAANGHSDAGEATALSGSGRFVVFDSTAANLPGGDGATRRIYVRDARTGKTRLVSKDNAGDPLVSPADNPGISASGRFISYDSAGVGLPGANGFSQVWLYDRKRKRTKLVSRANSGAAADADSRDPSASANGRRIAFTSSASNLPGATGDSQVYVRDLKRGRTILASKDGSGTGASGSLYGQTISASGRRVTFYSSDPDLPGSSGFDSNVYVRDLKRGRTILASRAPGGAPANGNTGNSSISGNGRFVAFESSATNLPGAGASSNQVYVRDLKRGRTKLGGRNSAGQVQTGYAEFAHLSGSGRYLQFNADGANLPGGDGSTTFTYVRDLRRGKTRLASRAPGGGAPDEEAQNGSISADGRFVAFESGADNLGGNTLYLQVFRSGPLFR